MIAALSLTLASSMKIPHGVSIEDGHLDQFYNRLAEKF